MTQTCKRCVFDASVPGISFDNEGICNYCRESEEKRNMQEKMIKDGTAKIELDNLFNKIRADGKNKKYDSLIGLSGGVDSSYIVYMAKQANLKPLLINLNNGYDTDIAQNNIKKIVDKTKFDLYEYKKIDLKEFIDFQLSFFKASVIDIEMVSDHAIRAALYDVAAENKIKYIIKGNNIWTEGFLPNKWNYRKTDYVNIRNIHKKFGKVQAKTYPFMSHYKRLYYQWFKGIKIVRPLNFIPYKRENATKILKEEFGWSDYGAKHWESIFTRFYQTYILTEKFKIDKRTNHYSNLIRNGEITREKAINELKKPPIPKELLNEDKKFVLTTLGISNEEFMDYMNRPIRRHEEFGTDKISYNLTKIFG